MSAPRDPTSLHTYQEILSQPEVWHTSLEQLQQQRAELLSLEAEAVVFTGCGSPYYLALSAAAHLQETGRVAARGLPASEVWLNPDATLPPGRALLVAPSRSGETTEVLRACQSFRAAGRGPILTFCTYPGRSLTRAGDVNLTLPAAQEQSVAQTRAFSSLFLATLVLNAVRAGRADLQDELARLPQAGRRLLEGYAGLAREVGGDLSIDRFYFLGSGARYGLACELSLKMKEMTLSHSEPFHFLEFRHGPRAMAGPGALVVGLVSQANARHELAVLEDMRAQGARTLAIGERDAEVAFGCGLSDGANLPLFLPFAQLMAFERAVAKRLNPDAPDNLDVFVKLEA
jgi:glucosamine--fructose-6-phosphate aminotransferase (isomerizing)